MTEAHPLIVSDPPPAGPVRQDRYANLVALMEDQPPGTWGRIATYASGGSTGRNAVLCLRRRKGASVPPGRWEFRGGMTTETDPEPHGYGVWACYLGPD